MDNTVQLIQETRELLQKACHNIDELSNRHDINISLAVGTDKKTVSFDYITAVEITMKATINKEL
jgi:hypothetical protein